MSFSGSLLGGSYLGGRDFYGNGLINPWSPSFLFGNAELGVWYDPSDVANLSWRRNLLTYSEDFSNAAWTKVNVVASSCRITANAVTGAAYAEFAYASAPSATLTLSYTFPSTSGRHRYVWLADRGIAGVASATFDLDDVSVIGNNVTAAPNISTLADGSVRCSITYTRPAVGTSSPQFALAGASHTSDRPSLTWAGGEFLEASAQLELGSTATEYQRITDVHTEVRERFPNATLFQDTAGTQPVTTAGQSVALMLDKSGNGLNATQSITASRPIYAVEPVTGRRNLLTYTEQFDNAAWTKIGATVSANVDTAPDGTQSADRLQANSGTVSPLIAQNITVGACSASIYAKAGTSAFIQLSFNGDGTSYVNFDLSLGSVGTSTGTASGTITALGSGWYRCSVANSATTITGFVWSIVASSSALRRASFSATGSENFLIWGAQVETGSSATAYQRVVSKYDVTEAGVPSRSYLSFDGIDDFMVTPTITPGIDKVQVFAGVRKLSDAASGILCELSATTTGNNGSFYIAAPEIPTYSFSFLPKGTSTGGITGPLLATYPAPISVVLAALGDRTSPASRVRVNGAQAAEDLDSQGTGNYLAYPLYIGRRGGATLPFNGNIYGLLVRFGANLSNSQVIAAERWLNNKTGAY